jgi:dTDP-4-dehydrorhamnose 3,5-epimerase-like enzyme
MAVISLKRIGDEKMGYLSFLETHSTLPFEIRRIYYIYDVPVDSVRGMHAHKRLKQALWCPIGRVDVLIDDGRAKAIHRLDTPEKVLLVGEGQWREMYWRSEGAVLCVAASEYYDESDYIRDYDLFLRLVKEGYWSNEG